MFSPSQIRAAVERHFEVVPSRSSQEELVFLCPVCNDSSGNRSVNLRTGYTNCWKCGGGGRIDRWLKHQGIEHDLEATQPATVEGVEASLDLGKVLAPEQDGPAVVTEIPLPSSFTYLDDPAPADTETHASYVRLAGRMARRKHLDLEDFVAAGAGLALGNPRWAPYVIFPILEWGRVVYFQGRTMIDMPGEPTKQFPSRNEFPRGSRYWLDGIDELRATGGVGVVVESILNRLSLKRELARRGLTGYTPVACFRHQLSPEQIAKFGRLRGLTELVLLYDVDATEDAHKEALRIGGRFPLVTVAEMPEGDANDNAKLAVDQLLARKQPDPIRLL
jgi:hypothetical protein